MYSNVLFLQEATQNIYNTETMGPFGFPAGA